MTGPLSTAGSTKANHRIEGNEMANTRVRRARFWTESLIAGAALVLGLMTLVWRDWIEAVFGVDPDNHSGALEWLVVAGLLVVAAVMGTVARVEWRRLQPAPVPSAS
jgi:uncharacterized membrane protein YcjF (UPF0283 family)